MRISLKSLIEAAVYLALLGWIALELLGALVGPSSFRVLEERRIDRDALRANVEALAAREAALARRAYLLNSKHVDADLLGERVRAVLGYAAEGEWVAPRADIEAALDGGAWPAAD